jgi:hypothetical protein
MRSMRSLAVTRFENSAHSDLSAVPQRLAQALIGIGCAHAALQGARFRSAAGCARLSALELSKRHQDKVGY